MVQLPVLEQATPLVFASSPVLSAIRPGMGIAGVPSEVRTKPCCSEMPLE